MKLKYRILHQITIKVLIIAIFSYFLSGCQSPDERLYLALIRPQPDWGKDIGRASKWHDQILQEWEPTDNIAMQHHAQEIADRIIKMARIPIVIPKVTVLKGNQQNAFTTGGGNIYLYEGLMEKAKNDDEIAMVIAHELGHCTADHIGDFYWYSLKKNLTSSSEDLYFPKIDISERESKYKGHTYAEMEMKALKPAEGIQLILTFLTSALSRQQEREADVLGAYYMDRAGYSLEEGVNFFFQVSRREASLRRKAIKELEPLFFQLKRTFDDYGSVKKQIYENPLNTALYVEQDAYLKRWLQAKDNYEQCLYKWKDTLFEIPAWFRSHPPVSERIKYLREVQQAIEDGQITETFTEEVKYTLRDLRLIEKGLPFPKGKK